MPSVQDLFEAQQRQAPSPMAPAWELALQASFGSLDAWRAAAAEQPPSGWLVLTWVPLAARLHWRWTADAVPAGEVPLLALDLSNGSPALDAQDWEGVYARYRDAVHASSEGCAVDADALGGAVLIDVRRAAVFDAARHHLPGARWRDPALVDAWAAELPPGERCVVYCVFGHEVGQRTALALRAAGVEARFLEGGIEGWQAAGRPLHAKA